ncbi:MAG: hypothetical protein KF812_03460 [Fimbriimonadaceae bacterium]|nr:hypothetical protein [Fimbriimonadaceae bacterium]
MKERSKTPKRFHSLIVRSDFVEYQQFGKVKSMLLGLLMASISDPGVLKAPHFEMKLEAPIRTWDEGIPLGNGLLGGLLWGGGSSINVSLDRGDLWGERPAKGMRWEEFKYRRLIELVRANDRAAIDDIFERAYNDVHPSKLPAGRLVIELGDRTEISSFGLNLKGAQGLVNLADQSQVKAIWSADEKAGVFHIPGGASISLRLMTPAMVAGAGATDTGPDSGGVAALGYPTASFGSEGDVIWYEQEAADGLRYAVVAGKKQLADEWRVVATVTSNIDGSEPVAIGKERVKATLQKTELEIVSPHRQWWERFWESSALAIPDERIQDHYEFVRYLYGAGSRRGAPPMPLQGVWTADAGNLPPWKGDYHNDLNTQMTYMGYQGSGDFDSGLSYLDFLWDRRDRFRQFAREFYETDGLSTPGVMTISGHPLAGWVQYSLSPTMTAWSAHLFYLHWRYTADEKFLRERAYPWCREAGQCIAALLKEDGDGNLALPLSSSPEIFDNSNRAWLKPNSNYDLMSMRMLFLSLVEMATASGDVAEAAKWQSLSDRLGDYHVREDGTLKLNSVEDLPGSHRHLSNLMGIHPFNLINIEQGFQARRQISRSLMEWENFGTQAWTGYSFSWMAALQARVGNGDAAFRYLDIYARAFVLRNGFHANGDQSGEGYSGFRYRPFTLEGNFLAMNAVHEMLLQSWSPTPGILDSEVIRVFPAVPDAWQDASFRDLRAEGGYRVSASREGGVTKSVSITANRDTSLRVLDNFPANLEWSVTPEKRGRYLIFKMRKNQTLNGLASRQTSYVGD